ncbi:peptidoglycan-binding protein [Streptomyces sp. NPDC016309]|uniref:peptidoglycan-binding domain-containing protein n=1 Tax=Streptomyces sp. NPDC016309 TaxID=3364965 RepID=UPI0036FB0F7D
MPLYVPLEPELVPLAEAGPSHGARAGARARARAEARSRSRARRPYAVVGTVAAVLAVVGVAGFAGGLFGGDGEADRVLPDLGPSTPAWPSAPEGPPETSGPASPSVSPSASASSSATVSASASAFVSASPPGAATTTAPASAPATASGTPKDRASVSASPLRSRGPVQEPSPGEPVTLARGDRGPEVAELQRRLREAGLYDGPMNGRYNDQVEWGVGQYQEARDLEGDEWGVYGPETRQWLESETTGR